MFRIHTLRQRNCSMLFIKYTRYALPGLLALASLSAQADTLVISASGTLPLTTAVGQSITTPRGGSFDHLSFNFYDTNLIPTAAGTLFLLTQSYAGRAGELNSATPGFVAASQSIAGGEYVFDTNVSLQSATQYFFYANENLTFTANFRNPYSGGILYLPSNNDIRNPFISFEPADANFRLSGVAAVPEPSTLALLTGAALTGAAFLRKRKGTSII